MACYRENFTFTLPYLPGEMAKISEVLVAGCLVNIKVGAILLHDSFEPKEVFPKVGPLRIRVQRTGMCSASKVGQ